MKRISSIDQIHYAIKRVRDLKKGYLTNLFLDPEKLDLWIDQELLYSLSYEDSEIFFKKNESFFNVFYCTSNIENLNKTVDFLKLNYDDLHLVFDIVGSETSLKDTIHVFNSNGFKLYTSLTRMSRINCVDQNYEVSSAIHFASDKDLITIRTLLYRYFDEYAEQLPLDKEIEGWIEKKQLLLFKENEQILGFVIFDIIGITSYLRYWFVHPQHRNKKVGSSLLRRYFYESKETKRQLFWVIKNNENAIIRYQHYGFTKENLVDYVFINIDKQYEDRNY